MQICNLWKVRPSCLKRLERVEGVICNLKRGTVEPAAIEDTLKLMQSLERELPNPYWAERCRHAKTKLIDLLKGASECSTTA